MSFWEILLVAFALAMDALAVSVGLGLCSRGSLAGRAARAALAFGLFQFGMSFGGSAAGRLVSGWIEEASHWVAAGILVVVGLRMLVEALRREPGPGGERARTPRVCDPGGEAPRPADRAGTCGHRRCPDRAGEAAGRGACRAGAGGNADPSRGWPLLALAVATSLDALGAGLGLAMVGAEIWLVSAVIGVVAAALSAAGVVLAGRAARKAGARLSRAAEVVGAAVLLGLAVKMALGGG